MTLLRLGVVSVLCCLMAAPYASAQYVYDPGNLDESPTATRYFGSIKDDGGRRLKDAGIIAQQSYVFMTDETGRFSGYAPDPAHKDDVIGCSKPGYQVAKLTKRFGVTNKKNWVQVDCVLRKQR